MVPEMMSEEAEPQSQEPRTDDNSSFVWDDTTGLYFHAGSGFYHDPVAGWYYSSSDGLYYKFDNGSYVLLASDQVESPHNVNYDCEENLSDAHRCTTTDLGQSTSGNAECSNNQAAEIPRPPSEWLEETLINLYLSGYNTSTDAVDSSTLEMDEDTDTCKLEEGDGVEHGDGGLADPGYSRDEENWLSQYGQVVPSGEEPTLNSSIVDLWDWAMVTDAKKDGQCQAARLVGRLVKQSAKLHPSVPSGGSLFKTAPICEAHINLVRVRTGQVYRLRSPSAKFLASLTTYNSSNPTKDWGFPELSFNIQDISQTKASGKSEPTSEDCKGTFNLTNQLTASKKQRSHQYRDRAAERRSLHGGFGIGHGQKSSVDDVSGSSSPIDANPEEAAAEAWNNSFGADSYARKILKTMGWKEGEGLGNTTKGMVEPIKPVGNIGNAGLGWTSNRTNYQG